MSADQNVALRIADGGFLRPPADCERDGHNPCAPKVHQGAKDCARKCGGSGSKACRQANRAERGGSFKEEIQKAKVCMRMLLCECDADKRCKKHQNGDEGEAERAAHGNGGKPPAEHFGIPVVADTGVRSQEQHSNGGDFDAACRSGGAAADNH